MSFISRFWLWRYSTAILSVVGALLLSILMRAQIAPNFGVLFIIVILFNVWYGGLRPGLLAVFLSAFAYSYFLLVPHYTIVLDLPSLPVECIYFPGTSV